MKPISRRTTALITLACLAVGTGGCGWLGGGNTSLRLESRSQPAVLEPNFTTAVYRFEDPNTLDVYLSDLPMARLLEAADGRLTEPLPPGTLARVHVFLNPRAGYTPIDYTASNATVTYVVMAGEVYGVYTGAGFFLPGTTPGEGEFSGKTSGANLKLAAATEGFSDRLGPSELSGRISAVRDDEKAQRLGALVSSLSRFASQN